MKTIKVLLAVMVLAGSGYSVKAQFTNMQFHKEFGSFKANSTTKIKRDAFRGKFEKLGFDSLGTYYINAIVRVSTGDKATDGSMQLLRTFKVSKRTNIQPLIGFQQTIGTTGQYYAGIHYPVTIGRVRFLPFVAYVFNKDQKSADFRFTSGYSTLLAKKKILIFGFINAFTKDKVKSVSQDGTANYGKEIGLQANPQFWFRFYKQLAVGTEIGLDYLHSRYQQFIVIPTAGFRWAL